jgi:ankyrin repeat protein
MKSCSKPSRNFPSRKSVFAVMTFALTLLLSLLLVSGNGVRTRRQVLFVDAARAGNVTSMRILLAFGAKIDEPECQYDRCLIAIIAAAWNGHPDAVQFLLDKGANVNARLSRGQTPLMVASYHGYKNIVTLLLAKGADTCLDSNGETALIWAERNRHTEVAELLRKAPCERARD